MECERWSSWNVAVVTLSEREEPFVRVRIDDTARHGPFSALIPQVSLHFSSEKAADVFFKTIAHDISS